MNEPYLTAELEARLQNGDAPYRSNCVNCGRLLFECTGRYLLNGDRPCPSCGEVNHFDMATEPSSCSPPVSR